jgi:hypothetical protein|tara:strand:- start:810 stop:1025 length:216 start_codon:yes stop_codon:yes gene_type:complete
MKNQFTNQMRKAILKKYKNVSVESLKAMLERVKMMLDVKYYAINSKDELEEMHNQLLLLLSFKYSDRIGRR